MGINSGVFTATPSSVNLTAAAFPITGSINSYLIANPVTGSINVDGVGGGGAFASLTNSGGLFEFINNNAVTGNVTINITADLTAETGTFALNAFASPFTILIKPTGAPRIVSGAANLATLIRLNGASRVTFDGSTSGGTDRSLLFENTGVSPLGVFRLGSIGTTPIVDNTVKNCTIRSSLNATPSAVGVQDTGGSLAGYFNNITIQNNDVQRALRGIFANAIVSGTNGSGLLITGNSLNTAGANSIRLNPIVVQGVNGVTISNNTIGNISDANAEIPVGILLSTGTDNAVVSGNTITGIVTTSTSTSASVEGILVSVGAASTNINVSGNTISTLTSSGTAPGNFYAIGSFSPNTTIANNTISGLTNSASGVTFWGIALAGASNSTVVGNNISAMNSTNATGGKPFGINLQGAITNCNVNGNIVSGLTSAGSRQSHGHYAFRHTQRTHGREEQRQWDPEQQYRHLWRVGNQSVRWK